MVLAFHPSHRFARAAGGVPVGDLDGEAYVGFDADLPIRRAVDRFLRKQGIHVQVSLVFDNIENVKRAVEIQAGVAILPAPTLTRELEAGTLRAARFRDLELTRPLAIIRRRGRDLGVTASRFLALLTESGPGAAVRRPGRRRVRRPIAPGDLTRPGRPARRRNPPDDDRIPDGGPAPRRSPLARAHGRGP